MNTSNEHIDELCAKVMLGEASEPEAQELRLWRAISAENENHFRELEKAYAQTENSIADIAVDVNAAWKKVQMRINGQADATPVIPIKRKTSGLSWKIAAAIVVLLGISIVLFQTLGTKEESFALQSFEVPVRDTLNDGTIAVLNANSELAYSLNAKEKSRKVLLKGEAYFEVQHNDSIDFIIQTDDLMIRDIGTSFNVKALPGADTVHVFVREGVVELFTLQESGIRIEAGETGYYVKSKKQFGKSILEEDVNPDTYATGDFRFRNTKLEKVVRKLNAYFQVDIALDSPDMKECAWSIHLLDSDLETILGVFADTFGFEIQRNGNAIVLKGGACPEGQ